MNTDDIETKHVEAEITEQKDERFQQMLQSYAQRILKKNAKEIKRLKKHAEYCLISGNKDGYVYAIGKLRSIYRQPAGKALLESMYDTSRAQVIEVAKQALKEAE